MNQAMMEQEPGHVIITLHKEIVLYLGLLCTQLIILGFLGTDEFFMILEAVLPPRHFLTCLLSAKLHECSLWPLKKTPGFV